MDAGSSLNLGGVEVVVGLFFYFIFFFCEEGCREQVWGNLAHLCGLGYFGSCNPGTSSFSHVVFLWGMVRELLIKGM